MEEKSSLNRVKKVISRKTEQKAELREKILAAAREMILENGYGSLSIRKLAARIGYAPGTIYLYFASRDAVIREICLRGLTELGAAMQTAASKESDTKQRLVAMLKSYADFAITNPETYQLSFMENPKFTAEIFRNAPLETESGAGRQALGAIAGELRKLKKSGEIAKNEDENLLAEVFWTAIHGVVSLKLIYPAIPFNSADGLIDKTIQILLDGIKK